MCALLILSVSRRYSVRFIKFGYVTLRYVVLLSMADRGVKVEGLHLLRTPEEVTERGRLAEGLVFLRNWYAQILHLRRPL